MISDDSCTKKLHFLVAKWSARLALIFACRCSSITINVSSPLKSKVLSAV